MEELIEKAGSAAQSGFDAFKGGASTGITSMKHGANSGLTAATAGWGKVKDKTRLHFDNANFQIKQPEIEFRRIVLQLSSKSEATLNMMEKRLSKRSLPRQKTEFELMKEKLKHIEFSDEEKGLLTKEQMEEVSTKVGEAKKILTEIEREGKSKGFILKNFIENYPEWEEELEYLRTSGLDIDLDGLVSARKRMVIRDIFFDPEAAERRRLALEEAQRLAKERELELAKIRKLAEEERRKALEEEKERLKKEQEEKERKLREEENARLALTREEEEKLRRYAEQERRKLQLDDLKRSQAEEENKAKRAGLLRKYSTTEPSENDPTDVGKLKFDGFGENEKKNRRRSVGKLNNPWDGQNSNIPSKPRSRRTSKVGKLGSTPISEHPDQAAPWGKSNSRNASRSGSRRGSQVSQPAQPIDQDEFMKNLQAVMGLEDLANNAGDFAED